MMMHYFIVTCIILWFSSLYQRTGSYCCHSDMGVGVGVGYTLKF